MAIEFEACIECHKWFDNKTLYKSEIKFDYMDPENNSRYIFKLCDKCRLKTSTYFENKSIVPH